MLDVGPLQPRDRRLRRRYVRKHVRLVVAAIERVVRLMAGALQVVERLGEALDFGRKLSHCARVLASPSRVAVLQGAIRLMPSIATALAHERVRVGGG